MVAGVFNYLGSVGSSLLDRTARDLNADSVGQPFQRRSDYYDIQEAYYTNAIYERHDRAVAAIKSMAGLSRYSRPILNPAKRAADWWPGHTWPGTWTADGLPARNGKPNRLPYDPDTPEPLRLAVQKGFTWGNWGSEGLVFVRTGAILGDRFAEIEVNLERRKVYPRLLHPRFVVDLEWNATGDLTMYRLEIPQFDPNTKQAYRWGKLVDKERIVTFYNDRPHGYNDNDAEMPNPYGFVPAVWGQHQNTGGQHGSPAIEGIHGKIDELNSLVTEIGDYIQRFTRLKVIVSSKDPAGLSAMLSGARKPGATSDLADPRAGRESIGIMPADESVSVHHLLENMGLGESDSHVRRIQEEIEKDLPEITLAEKLLGMSQVTRPGALPLVQDVQHKYDEVAGLCDGDAVRLGQMTAAIMGFELRAGTMGSRSSWTDDMRLFEGFDLDSFDAGDLNFNLVPRDLIPATFLELAAESTALEQITTPTGLARTGMSPDEIAVFRQELTQAQQIATDRTAAAFALGSGL